MYSQKTISNLPATALLDLMLSAVEELLDALEREDPLAVRAKQKQVSIIFTAIKEQRQKNNRGDIVAGK